MARWLLVGAVVVLLAAAAVLVAVPLAISRELSAEGVAQRATALAGRPVSVERVALAFRPTLRIRAEGIAIEGGGSAEAVEVEIALAPLLERRVEPEELHLAGARIPVERTAEGGFRVALLRRPQGGPGGAPAAWPALDVRDGEFFLVEADGTRADAPVLRIERLALAPLGHGDRAPLRLEIALDPAPGSRWSLGHAELEGAVSLREGAPAIESGRFAGRDARLRGLRVDRFAADFAYAGGVVTIDELDLAAYGGTGAASGRLALGRPTRFTGELSLADTAIDALVADWRGAAPPEGDPGRFRLGAARVWGEASLGGGATRVESARLEGRDARLRGLRIERFSGGIGYAERAITLQAVELAAYGGTGTVSGRVAFGPARFEGELALAGAALADLIADWRGRPFAGEPGRLDAEARLALPFASLGTGTGEGRVTLREGRIPARSLFDTLLGALGRLTGRLLSVGSATAPAPSRLETLGAGFTLREGRLHSRDLDLVTDDYRWRARGSLGLEGSLDFTGPLQLTSRGVQRMLASAALPLPAATAVIPEIPVRATGTLGAPSLAADTVGLPAAARGTLGGLVRGGGSVVKGAARGGESAVKGAARGLRRLGDKVIPGD